MNRKQLIALWVGVAALLGALVYPPLTWEFPSELKYIAEWASILYVRTGLGVSVDVWIWGVEITAIVTVTGALILTFKDRRSD